MKAIDKRFAGVHALKGVDFDLHEARSMQSSVKMGGLANQRS